MIKIAITGNIASGKSTVEKIIVKNGYPVYDTDKIAHSILENSQTVRDCFSKDDILTNGMIDRKKLGDVVFSNAEKLKLLESIIHPEVKKEILNIFNNATSQLIFISVPQLFETGFENLFDKIIFVDANKNIRLERLMKRNNLSKEQAELRINAQSGEEYKLQHSDFIIKNNNDIEELQNQVIKLLKEFI